MKRCPKCRRDYYDDSLLYCLDDGSALLDGPASTEEANTAVMTGEAVPEAATQILQPAERTDQSLAKPSYGIRWMIGAAAAVVLTAILGWAGYYYYGGGKPGQMKSIAVMPFVNESGNAELEYLSDGMTESLMNSLSQLPGLNVKSRGSVFRYKGKEIDAAMIGKELGVQAILNGRVVQRGDGITLYLELADETGNRIWGDQYNRKTSDLISLQGEIARDVSQKLQTRLSGTDEQKLKKNYTENVDAYQAYLKGRYHVFKLIAPEVQKSIEYFQKAIEIDPSYALAYAGLSDAYRSLALAGELDPNQTLPKAKAAANKAVELDADLAEAHTALGVCLFWYDWNWSASEQEYKRALELNPNSPLAHLFYAHLLSNIGRHEEALSEVRQAREAEPLSLFVNALEGQFLLHAGRVDESLDRLRQASELDPNYYFPHHFAASAYIEKGMYAEAVVEGRRAQELGPNQTVGMTFGAVALAKWGKRDEARGILDELLKLSGERFVPPTHIALIYNALGETDHALTWLEKGYELRDPKMAFLRVEPKWNNLRSEARFKELMTKMAFPE